MSSAIDTTSIDTYFPVAGQDNDTQGFRDNWALIKANLEIAKTEISAVQITVGNISTRVNNTNIPASSIGVSGDAPGQIASDGDFVYFCYGTYDGASDIWAKVATVSASW